MQPKAEDKKQGALLLSQAFMENLSIYGGYRGISTLMI